MKPYKKRKGNILYISVFLLAFILAGITAGIMYLKSLPSINQLNQYEPTLTSQIVSSDDVVIRTFGAYKYKKVSIDKIPDNLKKAIISVEDKNFYTHPGFDISALIRSALKNIRAGKIVQGASTITQQLARILFLSQEKTFTRKFKELVIAYRLEKTIPKDKILEMYLNNVYLGEGAYGVSAAAGIYFNKKIENLDLEECAMLAGLPQAPSLYSPYRNMKLAKERRFHVLKRMFEDGYLTKKEFKKAARSKIDIATRPKHNTLKKAPYFVDFVMRELRNKAGLTEQEVVQGGYKIYTTLNYKYQKAAEKSIKTNLKAWGLTKPEEQAALISYDVVSGQILAYVGGKDYSKSQFDRVSQAVRQPGSAFKIFVYTTAMEQGLTPFTVYPDVPIKIGDWEPQNYGREYRRKLPLYKGLALSSNVVAAQLIMTVGVRNVIKTARKMGITTPIEKDPTIALGSSGVKPIELATAYGVLANGGLKVKPYGIERIETSNGKVIYMAKNSYQRVLSIKTVAYMVEMMKQVVKYGTGRASNIGRPSAGKTGTTDGYKDAWFVGFTPDIVTAVWVGNDNNVPNGKITGGSVPAVIWRDYMKVATADKPPTDFMYPEIIVDTTYEPGIPEEKLQKILEQEEKDKQDEENTELINSDNSAETQNSILNKNNNKENKTSRQNPADAKSNEEFNLMPIPVKRIKVKPFIPVTSYPRGNRSVDTSGF